MHNATEKVMILLHQPICVSRLFHGQVHPKVTAVSPFVDHLHGTGCLQH